MLKKILTVSVINFVLLFIAFFIVNTVFTLMYIDEPNTSFIKKFRYISYDKFIKKRIADINKNSFQSGIKLRKPVGLEYKKKPIVLYGCSFTYGYGLDNKKNFGGQLSEYTKRPVYNFGISGMGLYEMLYFLEDENHYKLFPEPEYVIYTFMDDHFRRLYYHIPKKVGYLYYKEKNKKLTKYHPWYEFFDRFYMYRQIKNIFYRAFIENTNNENRKAEAVFKQSLSDLRKHYPNTKFIILYYPTDPGAYEQKAAFWKKIKQDGFVAIDLNTLTGVDLGESKYKIANDGHPNAEAWRVIVPKLAEKLKL